MSFKYTAIERVEKLTKEEFIKNYHKPQKPVVITNQIEDWPAFTKMTKGNFSLELFSKTEQN